MYEYLRNICCIKFKVNLGKFELSKMHISVLNYFKTSINFHTTHLLKITSMFDYDLFIIDYDH